MTRTFFLARAVSAISATSVQAQDFANQHQPRLVVRLGSPLGLATTVGPMTMYHGNGVSGIAVRSGPLTVYQGTGRSHGQTGIAVGSGPLTTYQGNGVAGRY